MIANSFFHYTTTPSTNSQIATYKFPTSWQECWPAGLPLPTEEEFEAARQLYYQDNAYWLANGDMSDFNMGLEFAIFSYNPALWLRFFYPEVYDYKGPPHQSKPEHWYLHESCPTKLSLIFNKNKTDDISDKESDRS